MQPLARRDAALVVVNNSIPDFLPPNPESAANAPATKPQAQEVQEVSTVCFVVSGQSEPCDSGTVPDKSKPVVYPIRSNKGHFQRSKSQENH